MCSLSLSLFFLVVIVLSDEKDVHGLVIVNCMGMFVVIVHVFVVHVFFVFFTVDVGGGGCCGRCRYINSFLEMWCPSLYAAL